MIRKSVAHNYSFHQWLAVAVIGFPCIWIGLSFVLGYFSDTMRIPYGLILPSGAKAQIFRILLPEFLALLFTLFWMRQAKINLYTIYQLRIPRLSLPFWFFVIGIFTYLAYLAWTILPDAMDKVSTGNLLSLLATCIVVGFAEETMYRGAIMQVARIYGYQEWQAWLFGTLAFGLLHIPNYLLGEAAPIVLAQFFIVMLTGTVFYIIYRQTKWLLFAIATHALWDFLLGADMMRNIHF